MNEKIIEEVLRVKNIREALSKISSTVYVGIMAAAAVLAIAEIVYEADVVLEEIYDMTHELVEAGSQLSTDHAIEVAENVEVLANETIVYLIIVGSILASILVVFAFIARMTAGSKEKEMSQVKTCLDGLANNVMMTDVDQNLIYMNDASRKALQDLAPEIRKAFAGFDPTKLMGQSIHQFHKNPESVKQRLMSLNPGQQHRARIKLGDLTFALNVGALYNGEQRTGFYAEWSDITKQIEDEHQATVTSSCLAGLGSNVMITDGDDNLVYMNDASLNALRGLKSEIRKTYENFDPDALIGNSIHQFHKNPDAVRRKIQSLTEGQQHRTTIRIGELVFSLNVGAIYNHGKRIGSYAEWNDITHQYLVENQVRTTAETISNATRDISQGNVNLSERTEAQAASIEETTASMQEIAERVNRTAQNAREALSIASTTRSAADRGGEVVNSAIQAMAEISESSKKINEIIGVIDEIAFQTNLLALNAAVEAARAGEQGRGFAVVASEVRSLAGRSAKAAKEIKDLITDSVEKVDAGTGQVNETGECLSDIITNVQRVADMVNEITSATQDQATGIDEINKAITQMDSFTQQNAALVEEAASSSGALSEQAGELVSIVNKVKSH